VIKALLTAITSLNCEVHGASLLLSIRACFHIDLMTKNAIIKVTAKGALTQMINVIIQRMEINDQRGTIRPIIEKTDSAEGAPEISEKPVLQPIVEKTPVSETSEPPIPGEFGGGDGDNDKNGGESFASIYHKDAYLLFRALCKLSMKGLSEDAQIALNDSIMLQNK
jgi:brefeldin A-inhibited guanine nucleotide-exchange protein